MLILLTLAGVASAFYGVSLMFGYHRHTVSSGAMSPTLEPSTLVVSRSLDGAEVHRGDVVLFDRRGFTRYSPPGTSVFRVVGVAGDTVACCAGTDLVVNGKPVHEPYLSTGTDSKRREATQPFTVRVPAGSVFVTGDNRGNANDSRFQGPVHLSAVSGIVVATGSVVKPEPLAMTTAFTDAGLPGAPTADNRYVYIRWFVAGGALVFLIGFVGTLVTATRSARRRAAASP
ncbi:MAG TPA: signal peptidase I [Amycolatopsis sp.]|nr:signal peptidase I [Amycolatopsis sp.]